MKQISIQNPQQDCNESRIITNNILNTTDYLFDSTIGWNEIPNDISRYKSSSNLLDISDSSGYSFLNLSKNFDSSAIEDCHTYRFEGLVLTMQSSDFNKTKSYGSTTICHNFESSSICIPTSAIQKIPTKEVLQVAVQYKLNTSADIFPTKINSLDQFQKPSTTHIQRLNLKQSHGLSEFLVGLAINNNMNIETIPEEPIEISFIHKDKEVI